MKRPTIKDIARLANVNPSTVSRALNNSEDISDALKERIHGIAKKLNYQPNPLALNLKNQRSNIIGLIIPEFSIYFIPSLIEGITRVLNRHNYKLLLLSSENKDELEAENIAFCIRAGVDGILLSISEQTDENDEYIKIAHEQQLPMLLFDNMLLQNHYHQVVMQDELIGQKAMELMIEHKRKNVIAILGYANQSIYHNRKKGLNTAKPADVNITYIQADTEHEVKEKLISVMNTNTEVDAIFCATDELMMGAYMALLKLNKQSDEHILFTGVSDGKLPNFINRNIYYIKHDGNELGKTITENLIDIIHKKAGEPLITFMPYHGIEKNIRY
jgi:LacI family transcriptional regulator